MLGDDLMKVAEQGDWADPSFLMNVYARAVRRRGELDGEALVHFDAALEWARSGTKHDLDAGDVPVTADVGGAKGGLEPETRHPGR